MFEACVYVFVHAFCHFVVVLEESVEWVGKFFAAEFGFECASAFCEDVIGGCAGVVFGSEEAYADGVGACALCEVFDCLDCGFASC